MPNVIRLTGIKEVAAAAANKTQFHEYAVGTQDKLKKYDTIL